MTWKNRGRVTSLLELLWFGSPFAYLKRMSAPTSLPSHSQLPATITGKHDFSWRAAHQNAPIPSAETVPESTTGSFWDFVDIINPLQHIPIVGNLYRAITGDTMAASSNILGGLLFGGPIGFLASTASAVVNAATAETTDVTTAAAQTATKAYARAGSITI